MAPIFKDVDKFETPHQVYRIPFYTDSVVELVGPDCSARMAFAEYERIAETEDSTVGVFQLVAIIGDE
jgi:hypothetical protein